MKDSGRIKIAITAILCVVLVGLLSLAGYSEQQRNRELRTKFAATEAAARPYEAEIEQLSRELAALQMELYYRPDQARLAVGFIPAEPSDIDYMREKAGEYGFTPALILDCSNDMEQLQLLVRTSDPAWDIVLYASGSTAGDYESILAAKAWLESIDRPDVGLFLITTANGYRPKRQQLMEDGFLGYTEYNDSPTSGQTQEGAIYMDYAYAKSNSNGFDIRVADICTNRASSLFVLDMSLVHSGAISDQKAEHYLATITQSAQGETACFATAGEAVEELSNINTLMAGAYAANSGRISEITARIEELESVIESIYSETYRGRG